MSVKLVEEADGKIIMLNLTGKVRLLVRMHDFHGWTLSAVWEDTKFGLYHFISTSLPSRG